MSRAYITFALLVSVTLMSGALWLRFSSPEVTPSGNLSAADTEQEKGWYGGADSITASISGEGFASSSEPLSETDLIGRQLFSDYIEVASQGHATQRNIYNLAERYASNIVSSASPSPSANFSLTLVTSSEQDLLNYSQKLASIRKKYQDQVARESLSKNLELDTEGNSFFEFSAVLADVYSNIAAELIAMPVPKSLEVSHRALVQNYLTSSESMQSFASIYQDPLKAYRALLTQQRASEEEQVILRNIQSILALDGIIFEPGNI